MSKEKLESIINNFLAGVIDGPISLPVYIKQFWKVHSYKLNRNILELIEPEDAIISASPVLLIEGVREMLNTDKIIGTELDLEQKRVIWFNFGDNKVKRFRELYGDGEIEAFYTDSYNDKDLMEISRKVFIVKKGIISDRRRI